MLSISDWSKGPAVAWTVQLIKVTESWMSGLSQGSSLSESFSEATGKDYLLNLTGCS